MTPRTPDLSPFRSAMERETLPKPAGNTRSEGWSTLAGWFLLALLLATLAGCGAPPRLSPLPEEAVILAFGDSLTFGTGATPDQSYPAALEALIGRRVVRSGVPGEETAQGLERLPEALETHRPALLILCHGGNDILRKRDRRRTVDNLRAMVRLARERRIDVVLVGVPAFGLLLSTADFYGGLAEELNLPFEGDALADILADNNLKSDMIHPNAAGYQRLARAIADLLRRDGAVP